MKVLITGGAGFIGSHLADRCVELGFETTVVDNLINGSLTNLSDVIDKIDFKKVDVCDYDNLLPVFENVDFVFHLAGLADIVPSINKPIDYHQTNVTGTINVLEVSRIHKVKKVVYAASASCYGIPKEYPTSEDYPHSPHYPYALTKMIGEQYLFHWARVYQLPVISLRLFNAYGPRSRTNGAYGAVFGVFLAQKLAKTPFTVVGDGSQKRDFTYVSDIVEAFITAAQSTVSGECFNVGTGAPQSIKTLVSLLGGPVEYLPVRPGEPEITMADISKIKREFGWEPQVSFEQGVSIMLENIDYWKEAVVWNKDSIASATKEWFRYLKENK